MSKVDFKYPRGSTPLDPNEKNGLIPDYISTQEELNSFEKKSIKKTIQWPQKA